MRKLRPGGGHRCTQRQHRCMVSWPQTGFPSEPCPLTSRTTRSSEGPPTRVCLALSWGSQRKALQAGSWGPQRTQGPDSGCWGAPPPMHVHSPAAPQPLPTNPASHRRGDPIIPPSGAPPAVEVAPPVQVNPRSPGPCEGLKAADRCWVSPGPDQYPKSPEADRE